MSGTRMSKKTVITLLSAAAVVVVGGAATAVALTSSDPEPVEGATRITLPELEGNEAIAVQVLQGLFEDGDLSVADEYIHPDYIQHNPFAPDGVEPLKEAVSDFTEQFPDAQYNVQRVLSQGDLVLVHSHVVAEPGTPGMAVVDMYDFEDDMITEHWDVAQDVSEETVNGNDMFSLVVEPQADEPETEDSQELVVGYFDRLMVDRDPDAVEYLAPEYHQHNPVIPSGSEGLREIFAGFFEQSPDLNVERVRVVAEGGFVAIHAHYRTGPDDLGQAVVDIFYTQERDGELKIVEHWDVIQEVPETSANDNTMF